MGIIIHHHSNSSSHCTTHVVFREFYDSWLYVNFFIGFCFLFHSSKLIGAFTTKLSFLCVPNPYRLVCFLYVICLFIFHYSVLLKQGEGGRGGKRALESHF